MRQWVISLFHGDGLKAKAMRGSALTVIDFVGANLLRLGSNLILTRLLFPEAFGLMAIVYLVMGALQMFSDLGINASIIQNERGDDPDFLNTAWVIQIVRGIALWLITCALAVPISIFYGEPMLASMLPVVGLNALISGFGSTNLATANRHLALGRLTAVGLCVGALGMVVMILLAYFMQSVWALAIGGLVASTAMTLASHAVLPGIRNRFRWDRMAVAQLFSFGKFIFLSTIAGYLISHGDRVVLGAYISLGALGIYNIGFYLGTVALILNKAAASKIIFPIYSMRPPSASDENRTRALKACRFVVAGTLSITFFFAAAGIPIANFLYDDRYLLSGPIVVLLSFGIVPQIVVGHYSMILLAAGDSKRFFYLTGSTALFQMVFMIAGVFYFGIIGAAVAPSFATLATYPLRISFTRRHKAWDPLSDFFFLIVGLTLNGVLCWVQWDAISALVGFG